MMKMNPRNPFTFFDISKLAHTIYSNTDKKKCYKRIWSDRNKACNKDIFVDHEFMSCFVTDQHHTQENGDHLTPRISSIQPLVTEIIGKHKIQIPKTVLAQYVLYETYAIKTNQLTNLSADSRKKGPQGGVIIRAYCSIKKGHCVPSEKGTLKSCSKYIFGHFQPVRIFTSIVMI